MNIRQRWKTSFLPMNRTRNSLKMNAATKSGSWVVSRSQRNTPLSTNRSAGFQHGVVKQESWNAPGRRPALQFRGSAVQCAKFHFGEFPPWGRELGVNSN